MESGTFQFDLNRSWITDTDRRQINSTVEPRFNKMIVESFCKIIASISKSFVLIF